MTEGYRETALRLSRNHHNRELLTIQEVERILGLDRRTIISHRLLPIRKVGNRLMISVADVADFLTRTNTKRY